MRKYLVAALAGSLAFALPTAANAEGIVVEGNVARAHSEWGGEFGAGYDFTLGGFTLRPMAGAFVYGGDDAHLKAYGKLEATYTVLGTTEFGLGARLSDDHSRLYGTLSFPVLPRIRVKANAGDKYFALGLRAAF